jgi:NarL family two-component system response regulator LiaR
MGDLVQVLYKQDKEALLRRLFVGDPIRVLLADDHTVVRGGIRALLEGEDGIEVVGEAADGEEAIEKARSLNPDVILLDLMMPEKTGIEAIEEIKQENPDARILVLTSFSDDDKVFAAIKAGALGYLLKQTSPGELFQAIHDVFNGESSLHPTIARKLIRELNRPTTLPPVDEPLTEREVEVLIFVARGLSNQDIADRLVISERTVRTHVSNILSKLHLANRTQAALYALKEGLTSLEQVET